VILYARQDHDWSPNSRNYRGFFRLLSELHIPFRTTNRTDHLDPAETRLVVVPEGPSPTGIEEYLESGGHLLVAGTTHPGLGVGPAQRLWTNTQSSYMRVEDNELFPSLPNSNVLFWEGEYLELEADPMAPLTLIPPGQFGPPDKVDTLTEETDKPGLVLKNLGRGSLAFVPWNLGELYYLFSNDKHKAFVSDLVEHLLAGKRQLVTNAHPQVEITIMKKGTKRLVHLVNLLGHSGTAFFDAPELRDIRVQLGGRFERATALRAGKSLNLRQDGRFVTVHLPSLHEYELILLE
jgi:hypothetical protein